MRRNCLRKLLYISFFIFGLTVSRVHIANAENEGISIIIDGKAADLSKKPVTINNVNYVPLRGVLEQMGVSIRWDQSSSTIRASKGAQLMEYTLGNSYARINNKETVISATPRIIDGAIMVPLRFVGEAFGAAVTWNSKDKKILISSDEILLTSISPETTGSSASNLMNNSFVVKQGNWIYGLENEQSGYPSGGNGGYLYKVNENGGAIIALISSQARMLNVQDDWIYYIGMGGVYKIRTNGNEATRLTDSPYSTQLYLMNNWLFYNTEDGIYRLQTDRPGAMAIRVVDNSNVDEFTVSQGWVYYKEFRENEQAGMLGRIQINGMDPMDYGRLDYEGLTVQGEYIYFNYAEEDMMKIGRMPIKGGKLHHIAEAEGYNISNNALYYARGSLLYRSNLDGSDSELLANLEFWSMPLKFIVSNDSVFYEKSVFDESGKFASAVYSVDLTAKTGASLFGKVLPKEQQSTDYINPYNGSYEVIQYAQRVLQQTLLPAMTPREEIKALHDYVVKNTAYDYDNFLKDTVPEMSRTVYGTLLEHKAVCQGYALTMNLLLELAGIESYYVTGVANGGAHAWNVIVLDGVYYHLDATWDDPVPDSPGNVRYDYFMISDEKMALDHNFDKEEITDLIEARRSMLKEKTRIDKVKINFK
ncbi:hypothetical protein BK146_06385 [Paenibacillus sp. FSL R7-0333]|nr:hypothetical protein BK146_06385 [Paenibacillus sp. FSL R7-0333]